MDRTLVGAAVAVAAVVIAALLMRRGAVEAPREGTPAPSPEPEPEPEPETPGADEDGEDDALEPIEVVAVTSEGDALVPDTHAVRLVPPAEEGEAWKAGATAQARRGQRALDMSWHAGDFTGGRVVRGAADEGPWRFEGLGRDGEYLAMVFETREGADAALGLFRSRGVIRHGHDDEGRDVPPSPEQFEEARRVYLETEAALDEHDDL